MVNDERGWESWLHVFQRKNYNCTAPRKHLQTRNRNWIKRERHVKTCANTWNCHVLLLEWGFGIILLRVLLLINTTISLHNHKVLVYVYMIVNWRTTYMVSVFRNVFRTEGEVERCWWWRKRLRVLTSLLVNDDLTSHTGQSGWWRHAGDDAVRYSVMESTNAPKVEHNFKALWFCFVFTWLELTRNSDRKSCAHWRRETVRTRWWRKLRLPSLLIGWFSVVRCGRSQNPRKH